MEDLAGNAVAGLIAALTATSILGAAEMDLPEALATS